MCCAVISTPVEVVIADMSPAVDEEGFTIVQEQPRKPKQYKWKEDDSDSDGVCVCV